MKERLTRMLEAGYAIVEPMPESKEEILEARPAHAKDPSDEELNRLEREEFEKEIKKRDKKILELEKAVDKLIAENPKKDEERIYAEDHSMAESLARMSSSGSHGGEGRGGGGERTRSGIDPFENPHVIIAGYTDYAMEQRKQVLIEMADYLVRRQAEVLPESISTKMMDEFMDRFGSLNLENQLTIISSLQAVSFDAFQTMEHAGDPQTSLQKAAEEIKNLRNKDIETQKRRLASMLGNDGTVSFAARSFGEQIRLHGRGEKGLRAKRNDINRKLSSLRQDLEAEVKSPQRILDDISLMLTDIKDTEKILIGIASTTEEKTSTHKQRVGRILSNFKDTEEGRRDLLEQLEDSGDLIQEYDRVFRFYADMYGQNNNWGTVWDGKKFEGTEEELIEEAKRKWDQWSNDLKRRYEQGEISATDIRGEVEKKSRELERLDNVAKAEQQKQTDLTREEHGHTGEEQRDGGRRQIRSIEDVARGIEVNNPEFAPGGAFPIMDYIRDEQGNIIRDRHGRGQLQFSEENFLRWARDRMIYLHNEDPDNPNVNFFSVAVDIPDMYRAIQLRQMIMDPGRYFKRKIYRIDEKTGEWTDRDKDDPKKEATEVMTNLKDEVTRHAWLFGAMRSMDITYRQVMVMDSKIGETLMNIYQNNVLTKVADEGKTPLYWILTIPEHFKENARNDMNVGEAIRTALLTYRSITDYPELERLLGQDSDLFKLSTIENQIKEIMRADNRDPSNNYLSKDRMDEIRGWFENGELRKTEQEVIKTDRFGNPVMNEDGTPATEKRLIVDPKIQIEFTDFLNVYDPERDSTEIKLSRALIQKALQQKYEFRQRRLNPDGTPGEEITDTQSLQFAEMYAFFMTRFMLFGGRNDRGAKAMDAAAKALRIGQNRSRKYSSTSAGGSGNVYDSLLLEAVSVDFLLSAQTLTPVVKEIEHEVKNPNEIYYTEEEDGKSKNRRKLQDDEEIIEIPDGYELETTDDGVMSVKKIDLEWRVGSFEGGYIDTVSMQDFILIRNEKGGEILEKYDKLHHDADQDREGRITVTKLNLEKTLGSIETGKVVVKRGTNEVIRKVSKQKPIEADANVQNQENNLQDKGGSSFEVRYNEEGKRILIERRSHRETILDVLEKLEEMNNLGATQEEKLALAEHLEFQEDTMRQLASNQYNRAFQLFLMINDAEELEIANYAEYSKEKGYTFDEKKFQDDFKERFIKPWRYATRTWSQLDFSHIVRAPDPDGVKGPDGKYIIEPYEQYKYMHLAEAMFGKQIIETFRDKKGEIDWEYFDTGEGKAALFKTYIIHYCAAQIYNHKNKQNNIPYYDHTMIQAYKDALARVPSDLEVGDRGDFTTFKVTEGFFKDFNINRNKDKKNYMKILEKASKTGAWGLWGKATVLALLGALLVGAGETVKELAEEIGD